MKTSGNKSKTLTIPVIMICHAQSQWNLENRFTGWAEPPLTAAGIKEARSAVESLRTHGYRFDAAYSTRLQRAIITLDVLLQMVGQHDIPCCQDWRLNERHYGAMQGIYKHEASIEVGEHQVWRWRRGYSDRAAPSFMAEPEHPANDACYSDIDVTRLLSVENLADTRKRVMEFWNELIQPAIKQGNRLLISAHGNSLRAQIMELAGMSIEEVENFEIPTATPSVYTFSSEARPLHWNYLKPDSNALISA